MIKSDCASFKAPAPNWSILAICRFFLAFVVLNHHMEWFTPNAFSSFVAMFGGKAAVLGFLVISGYSVTTSFETKPDQFIKRRFIRIYPAYAFAVVLAIIMQSVLGTVSAPGQTFAPDKIYTIGCNVVLLQMYACKALSYDPPIWSLSIEFSFYVLVSLALLNRRAILAVLVTTSLLYFAFAHRVFADLGMPLLLKMNMVSYFWPFGAGVYLARSSSGAFGLAGITAIGMVVCLIAPSTPEPLSALTFLIAMVCLFAAKAGCGRKALFLDHMGDVSYPLYLLHVPIAVLILYYSGTGSALVITLVTIAVAAGVTVLIERPFARRLKRLGSVRIAEEDRLRRKEAPDDKNTTENSVSSVS